MRILLIFRHQAFLRNFNEVITSLKKDGHIIHIGFVLNSYNSQMKTLDQFKAYDMSNLHIQRLPKQSKIHFILSMSIRRLANYFRYHSGLFEGKFELIARVEKQVPLWLRFFFIPFIKNQKKSAAISNFLWYVYEKLPSDTNISSFIQSISPEVIAITPAVDDSMEVEYIRAAKKLNIPNAILVASWDNLTNKTKIGVNTDRLIVWNDTMKEEAFRFHGINKENVVSLGAPIYDYLFQNDLLQSRSIFLKTVGIAPEKEYLLYAASSPFISKTEMLYFKKIIQIIKELNSRHGLKIGILVRPHPANSEIWETFEYDEDVLIWPQQGEYTICEASRQRYFNSIYHSKGIIGINTSTFIEALILERPIFTIRTPDVYLVQDGTHHFQHLVDAGLDASPDFESFADAIQSLFENTYEHFPDYKKFKTDFIRPVGINIKASDLISAELISMQKYDLSKKLTSTGERY